MVRCKFTCIAKHSFPDGCARINMMPVYSGSEENKQFFMATPTGKIELEVLNATAAKQFEQGKEYYIDISLAK